ncbi:4Fe-4S dicluster domain-containing protein [Candidatus Bathyarchaeota archaeon]|nr:4Fe-4S dicluster domain-containing protein [Candidatus Bathyarchaeota archaeon]
MLGEIGGNEEAQPIPATDSKAQILQELILEPLAIVLVMKDDISRQKLEKTARGEGADLFGIADLTPALDFIYNQGGDFLKDFPRAISIGVRLLDGIVDRLPRHSDPYVVRTYQFHVYGVVNPLLDRIAFKVAKEVQDDGYTAFPVPASQGIDRKENLGVMSHKLAANLAGLGWIGKSCLLVTPDYGPRIRFATVLTDAPLETGAPQPSRCGDCRVCIDVCPVKAFTGLPFHPSESREARFKAELCAKYIHERPGFPPGESACGLCVYTCPHGRRRGENNR